MTPLRLTSPLSFLTIYLIQMPEVEGIDKLLCAIPKQRFSKFREFGTAQSGFTRYGEEDLFLFFTEYGNTTHGIDEYANILLLSGIYRTDNVTGTTKFYREPFYITKNPRTETQQANRQKYADGIAAWQLLTDEQKEIYNKKAIGKRMFGYHLFLKEYLLSN